MVDKRLKSIYLLDEIEVCVKHVTGITNVSVVQKEKIVTTHAPILTKWIPNSEMIIETDASDYALSAIVSSRTPDSKIHPIAFHSHSFNSAELNYDTHDKELLTIFEAFKHW